MRNPFAGSLKNAGPLAALLLIIAVFGAIAAVGFTISVPASGWIQKAQESLPLLKEKLAILRQPLDYLQSGLKEIENITGPNGGADGAGQTVAVKQGSGLAGSLATGTATTLSRSFTTMITLFFLLASGDRLLRGFVESPPIGTHSGTHQAFALQVSSCGLRGAAKNGVEQLPDAESCPGF
jgi:predicted PurR-regulated permease PerM